MLEAAPLADWAYGFALNSEDVGVGTIYYSKAYFEAGDRVNPATAVPYTQEELDALTGGAVAGAENYIGIVPANALVGMNAIGTDAICWYAADASAAIVSSADPLALTEDGSMVNLDGDTVAEPLASLNGWAYGAISLDSEDLGIGTVYYAESYYETEGRINPVTVAPYTEEELSLIKAAAVEGNDAFVSDIPESAVIGISVFGSDEIVWFDAEAAEMIVKSVDPLILDAEAKTLITLEGEVAADAIAE